MGQEKNKHIRAQRAKARRQKQLMIGGGVAAALLVVVAAILMIPGSPDDWDSLVEEGQWAMDQVETPEYQGDRHLAQGTRIPYESSFPTSGAHWPRPTPPGFYTQEQPNEALVHAIEHGNINVYYDQLSEENEELLRSWTSFYDGTWSAVNAVPHAGLGEGVVLTAWNHRLRLDSFDPAAMAAFIEAYRGRGPENPVR